MATTTASAPYKIDVVVTRHPALLDLLKEQGVDVENAKVLTHASPDEIRGRVVAGILPLHLAALAEAVLVADLEVRPEDRGRELSLEELRERFRGLSVYKVEKLA